MKRLHFGLLFHDLLGSFLLGKSLFSFLLNNRFLFNGLLLVAFFSLFLLLLARSLLLLVLFMPFLPCFLHTPGRAFTTVAAA